MNGRVGNVLAAAGAILGAVVGFAAFVWLARQGLYVPMLPGALVGLGCSALFKGNSKLAGILCGVLGLLLGVLCEWRMAPFIVDPSLAYFLTHLHQVRPIALVLIALGGLFAFWLGQGRGGATPQQPIGPTSTS